MTSQYKANRRQRVFAKTNGHCAYCGCKLLANWTIDHLVPKGLLATSYLKGEPSGVHHVSNLLPSCQACNWAKGKQVLEAFRKQLERLCKNPVTFYFETMEGSNDE